MKKFEYIIVDNNVFSAAIFNRYGNDGWELCFVVGGNQVIYKRERIVKDEEIKVPEKVKAFFRGTVKDIPEHFSLFRVTQHSNDYANGYYGARFLTDITRFMNKHFGTANYAPQCIVRSEDHKDIIVTVCPED